MEFDPCDCSDTRDPRDPRDHGEHERDHDDDALPLGRGPSSANVDEHHDRRDRDDDRHERERADYRDRHDACWPDRDRDPRDGGTGSRNVFTRGLNLPRGCEREMVHDARDREYTLRGSESRSLATVGAFRVVPARDLRDRDDRPGDPRNGDLRHLRQQGLIETVRIPGYREQAVVLTDRGRDLLEANRARDRDTGQAFYAGLKRERELEHDAQIYRAYERAAARLEARGLEIEGVRLDYELKCEYQQWLHERDRPDATGRPDRDAHEIEQWAHEHELPYSPTDRCTSRTAASSTGTSTAVRTTSTSRSRRRTDRAGHFRLLSTLQLIAGANTLTVAKEGYLTQRVPIPSGFGRGDVVMSVQLPPTKSSSGVATTGFPPKNNRGHLKGSRFLEQQRQRQKRSQVKTVILPWSQAVGGREHTVS